MPICHLKQLAPEDFLIGTLAYYLIDTLIWVFEKDMPRC